MQRTVYHLNEIDTVCECNLECNLADPESAGGTEEEIIAEDYDETPQQTVPHAYPTLEPQATDPFQVGGRGVGIEMQTHSPIQSLVLININTHVDRHDNYSTWVSREATRRWHAQLNKIAAQNHHSYENKL